MWSENGDRIEMKISKLYLDIYREQLSSEYPRFLVFYPKDRSGWGNKVRGLTFCFLFSLCTRRLLVVRDFLIVEHFKPPEGTNWSIARWKRVIKSRNDMRVLNLRLRPDNWDDAAWANYESQSMDDLFPESVLVLDEAVSFADAIVANARYAQLLNEIGIDRDSKISWVGALCEELLSHPTDKLLRKVKKITRRVGFPAERPVGIQFRTFFDIGSPKKRFLSSFIASVGLTMESQIDNAKKQKFYVITDDRDASAEISKAILRFGHVITTSRKTIHTGGLHVGIQALIERPLLKLFGECARGFDFYFWLPVRMRPRPHTWVLAEWYLLGECDPIYSTFTSFGVFAAARRGNRARLWKFEEKTGAVAPLADDSYFF